MQKVSKKIVTVILDVTILLETHVCKLLRVPSVFAPHSAFPPSWQYYPEKGEGMKAAGPDSPIYKPVEIGQLRISVLYPGLKKESSLLAWPVCGRRYGELGNAGFITTGKCVSSSDLEETNRESVKIIILGQMSKNWEHKKFN